MNKASVIDTSLLILLVVGSTSRKYIRKHKRLRVFSEDDFDILLTLLSNTTELLLTPNTLSEASNLLRQIEDPARSSIYTRFGEMIRQFDERYVASRQVTVKPQFVRIGLTDSVLLSVAAGRARILTTDFDLYREALRAGYDVINFNHYRELPRTDSKRP